MSLDRFPITKQYPPQHPDRLQLYSLPTPNGVKVSIMLEEIGLPYEAHKIDFSKGEQKTDAFKSLNPNAKIPAILDPDGPLALWESGAILQYLADKTGKLMPKGSGHGPEISRWHAIQWLTFQVGNIGPMFGQVGFFVKFAGKEWEDKRPRDHYAAEVSRLLGVMNDHLATRQWFVDDEFSIADISMLGMVRNLIDFYKAGDLVGYDRFTHVHEWFARGLARPAVQRGLTIPG